MGNDQADAMRAELHDRIIKAYGDLKTASAAMGIPYKTLYRALTKSGKDRVASVSLDFIVDAVTHLQREFGGDDLGTVYEAALHREDYALAALDAPDWQTIQEHGQEEP